MRWAEDRQNVDATGFLRDSAAAAMGTGTVVLRHMKSCPRTHVAACSRVNELFGGVDA